MFIQVMQGKCGDEQRMHERMDAWREQLEPGAEGYLGSTYGIDDAGELIAIVRFDSRESAMRNSARPEQGQWWAETEKCFDGPVTFHDCEDAQLMLDGGSDDAGFVQVIQGRLSDPGKMRALMNEPMDMLHRERPEILGGTMAIDADGWFTQTVAFSTESAAREGEQKQAPPEIQEQMAWVEQMMSDVSYHDLHHPRFATAGER